MKRILGLDLGSSSIGWAVIEEYSKEVLSDNDIVAKDKIVAIIHILSMNLCFDIIFSH